MSQSDTQAIADATKILDVMLGYLGFFTTIEEDHNDEGPGLQILSDEARLLIGRHGDRLDDIQFLLNRLLQQRHPDAPRIRIDAGHYRRQREEEMVQKIAAVAERVAQTGKPIRLNPLNSYYRRIVHNALKDNPAVKSESPPGRERLKRIIVRPAK